MTSRIALIGDYNERVRAHQAIPRALALAGEALESSCAWEWVNTTTLGDDCSKRLAPFQAIWCVPATPYANMDGALSAIRWARESGRPFLGTCGGFQHAVLEYAANVWRIEQPAHAETDPDSVDPIIAPLSCELVEKTGHIRFVPGSRLAGFYGALSTVEEYHCRYGFSERHAHRFANDSLRVNARDEAGAIRGIELDGHPFFFGTLFQPERWAFSGRANPLVTAFTAAACA